MTCLRLYNIFLGVGSRSEQIQDEQDDDGPDQHRQSFLLPSSHFPR